MAKHTAKDAETLAQAWFALAESGERGALFRALAVGRRRIEAARDAMRADPARYAVFQAALVEGLEAPSARERFEAAHALDVFGDASTREALTPLMDDAVPRVRWMAMHALSCHACGEKPDALEAEVRARIARAATGDPSPRVRRHAATALVLAGEAAIVSGAQ